MKLYRHPFIQTLVFRKDETCHFFVSLFNKDTFEFFPFLWFVWEIITQLHWAG